MLVPRRRSGFDLLSLQCILSYSPQPAASAAQSGQTPTAPLAACLRPTAVGRRPCGARRPAAPQACLPGPRASS